MVKNRGIEILCNAREIRKRKKKGNGRKKEGKEEGSGKKN
jgi:hypothetical protein